MIIWLKCIFLSVFFAVLCFTKRPTGLFLFSGIKFNHIRQDCQWRRVVPFLWRKTTTKGAKSRKALASKTRE